MENLLFLALSQPIPVICLILCLEFGFIAAYHRLCKAYRFQLASLVLYALLCFNFLLISIVSAKFGLMSVIGILPFVLVSLFFSWIQAKDTQRKRNIPSDVLLLCLWFGGICASALIPVNTAVNLIAMHIAVVIIGLMLYWPQYQSKQKVKNAPLKQGLRLGFTALLMLSYILPPLVNAGNHAFCSWQNFQIATPIIEELEAYQQRTGFYPDELSQLNTERSNQLCQTLAELVMGIEPNVLLDTCFDSGISTTLYILGSTNYWYEFETKTWHTVQFNLHLCDVLDSLE